MVWLALLPFEFFDIQKFFSIEICCTKHFMTCCWALANGTNVVQGKPATGIVCLCVCVALNRFGSLASKTFYLEKMKLCQKFID